MVTIAAYVFAALALFVALFQLALVAGAPWGHLTQGGTHPGRLPPAKRAAAALSGVLIVVLAGLVLIRAGALAPGWQEPLRVWIWLAVAVSALTTLANAASRSRAERTLWLPVGLGLLGSSLVVALG